MHMSDALLTPAVAGTMYAASAIAVGAAVTKIRKSPQSVKVAEAGVMGAFVFAAQMINFSIPGTGSSGHICGGMLLAAVLGPAAGFLTMAVVLLVQCLLFADGGILAYGANLWNMAFYGCMLGGGVIWPLMTKGELTRKKIFAASIVGNIVALQLGAFSVTLETLASGITKLPFSAFVLAMLPIHLAIGTVEGLITGAVLSFVYDTRPEMLEVNSAVSTSRFSRSAMLAIFTAAALAVGGLLSLAASSSPDGLEWSMEKVAGTSELESSGDLHSEAAAVQEKTALLPDYNLPESESAGGNILSGVVGSLIVLAICCLACGALNLRRNRQPTAS